MLFLEHSSQQNPLSLSPFPTSLSPPLSFSSTHANAHTNIITKNKYFYIVKNIIIFTTIHPKLSDCNLFPSSNQGKKQILEAKVRWRSSRQINSSSLSSAYY